MSYSRFTGRSGNYGAGTGSYVSVIFIATYMYYHLFIATITYLGYLLTLSTYSFSVNPSFLSTKPKAVAIIFARGVDLPLPSSDPFPSPFFLHLFPHITLFPLRSLLSPLFSQIQLGCLRSAVSFPEGRAEARKQTHFDAFKAR